MNKIRILWTDDEIDFLKSHILFLENKGFEVLTSSNADDTLHILTKEKVDIVFLDENMPGKSGLEILPEIKTIYAEVPVVMITKSEEENLMEEAIGSQIDDYLIKPVNPNQILLCIKKCIDQKKLVSQKTQQAYQAEFGRLGTLINQAGSFDDWAHVFTKLVYWELEFEKSNHQGMEEVLKTQKSEANKQFSKFVKANYKFWIKGENKPVMSMDIFPKYVFPLLNRGEKVVFLLIDNLRYDQWKVLYSSLQDYFRVETDHIYCSILPTATQYARNTMFSGLMPAEISKKFPEWWVYDDETEGKNLFEEELLKNQMERRGQITPFIYKKIIHAEDGQKLLDQITNYINQPLTVLVYNFVDMLSHARTDSKMIKELAADERAYRSLTLSWFQNSALLEVIKKLSELNFRLVLTTDHGTMRVNRPVKVIGDRKTSLNLRYKTGRNLNYPPNDVFEIIRPEEAGLPRSNVSSRYIFALNDTFFAYPNNYNYYVTYYKNTFQHGGVSMEEMLVPVITLTPKA